jgi:signal transduction histidine kinase
LCQPRQHKYDRPERKTRWRITEDNISAIPAPSSPTHLHFDVSSGLKSVLGGELITNDEVAIFELVKNSFDAGASQVDIHFDKQSIVVLDNGIGMSSEDIEKKWLFVAYSSKRQRSQDFRDDIAERRRYAGSKGIGRFSSDRLGGVVVLQTRPKSAPTGPVHALRVDWDRFDVNHLEHFEKVPVDFISKETGFGLPDGLPKVSHGTAITIEGLRKHWQRDDILRLKSALSKLINPFGAESDGFRITIYSPDEKANDDQLAEMFRKRKEELSPNSLVNGAVGNFIFSTLQEKTTFIEVSIADDGRLESTLIDRGELIYRVREPNQYPKLVGSGFAAKVFFLNQSAKMTFAKRMGVPSVQFGSIFVFRNGFRVYPIGEEGDDWFGIDRRKQQGYSRFLGTRELIGRIDVSGTDENFQEASSRNSGLIETIAVQQLRKCVREHCLKRLERYVVPVTFIDKEDKNTSDVSRLLTDPGRARVAAAVAKLVDSQEVELIEYSQKLISILDERSSQFEGSLASLRAIAEKTRDQLLFQKIEEAEKRFSELRESEAQARIQADEERKAKEAAERRANTAEAHASRTTVQLEEEKKRNLFLTSIASLDTQTILNLHHQVTMYAVDINQQIENFLLRVSTQDSVHRNDVLNAIERISLLNKKIMGVSKFATKANFRLESEHIKADMGEYIEQYINGVAKDFLFGPLRVAVETDGKGFEHKFKPIDVSVVVDNLIANAKKAGANRLRFEITHPNRDSIHIAVIDNGRGFNDLIDNLERVFEKGFTTTDGSGLGLYHVRMVLGEMNGTIQATKGPGGKGATFSIRISR